MDELISRQAAIEALKNDMASLDHIIKGMSAMDVRLDAYVSQRNQVVYDIDAIEQLPPIQPVNCSEFPNNSDAISRQKAINALYEWEFDNKDDRDAIDVINGLPPIQPEIVRCKDCQYWNKGSCECPEHAVNCQDYYVGDIETEAEYFCGYAERREVNK